MNRILVIKLTFFIFLAAALFSSWGKADDGDDKTRRNTFLETRNLLRGAIQGIDERDYNSALQLLDSVLVLDSANADAFYLKAQIFLNQNDSLSAIEVLTQATELTPRSSRIKLLLARVHLKMGNWEEPLALTEEVLRVKPSDGEGLYLKALGLLQQGDTVKAIEKFEAVLKSEFTGKRK